ncbi:hypothetical protein, partial [Brachyspira sp.]|uniref:hypothetical protein n=1 Tax=Brachyspira sp. TaxID=1977261 RepID=UPI003D7E2FE6
NKYLLEITTSDISKNIIKITSDRKNNIVLDNIIDCNLNKVSIEDNEKKLEIIRNLKNNWNYYGAKPISKKIINIVSYLIKELIIQPKIFPTANGSIQLEYYDRMHPNKYLEFEVINRKNIKMYQKRQNNISASSIIDYDNIQKINNIIIRFYGIKR